MASITKKNYPVQDGWVHATLTLDKGKTMNAEELKRFLAFSMDGSKAETQNFEFGLGEQKGRTIKGCIRRKTVQSA